MRLAFAFFAAALGAFLIHAGLSGKPIKDLLTGGLPTGTIGSKKQEKNVLGLGGKFTSTKGTGEAGGGGGGGAG